MLKKNKLICKKCLTEYCDFSNFKSLNYSEKTMLLYIDRKIISCSKCGRAEYIVKEDTIKDD